jgi:hypothetical protein
VGVSFKGNQNENHGKEEKRPSDDILHFAH